ncbi:MAG: glycosyltransferase [Lachnospiraceae bacterium]|nr:glycosyltransferase [Lachnospiraceae bacterium]
MTVDVIIPTYHPDERLSRIVSDLARQSTPPSHIILINSEDDRGNSLLPPDILTHELVRVINIKKDEFDHGGTRNAAATGSEADFLLFMTQDAVPYDDDLISNMLKAFEDTGVAAVYARQLPDDDASPIERFSRSFNYPEGSCVKSKDDKTRLGIKTYFCSNACAMYQGDVFRKLGMFPVNMIFNEDMVFAHTLIENGYRIAYCAKAKVYHSHNYTNMQQFHRNFDLAVSQAMHPEVFESVSSESEGAVYVKKAFSYFLKEKKPWYFIPFGVQSVYRLAGYKLGKKYATLPKKLVRRFTASPGFFDRQER